jgi:hypothetical protein
MLMRLGESCCSSKIDVCKNADAAKDAGSKARFHQERLAIFPVSFHLFEDSDTSAAKVGRQYQFAGLKRIF